MRQTAREWTQIPENQTARVGSHALKRGHHFDEEEFHEDEEDFFSIMEEERQHWEEVERIEDPFEESEKAG